MRLANQLDRFYKAGAEVVALVVDLPERNAAMARRWGIPFPIVSDPGGEHYLKALGLWNAEERGGIAVPALIVIDRDGNEALRHVSRDFADRVHDEDVFQALERKGYPALDPVPGAWKSEVAPAEEAPGAFSPQVYMPLMNGNYFGALALARRITDEASLAEVKAHAAMSKSFVDAWKERSAAMKSQ